MRDPPHGEVRRTFEAFYTTRFATRDGSPETHWDDVETLSAATAAVVTGCKTEAIRESPAMCVVGDLR